MSDWSEIQDMMRELSGFDDRILVAIRESGGVMTTLELGDRLLAEGVFSHWHSCCNVKASCSRLFSDGKIKAVERRACKVSGNLSSVWKVVDLPDWA